LGVGVRKREVGVGRRTRRNWSRRTIKRFRLGQGGIGVKTRSRQKDKEEEHKQE